MNANPQHVKENIDTLKQLVDIMGKNIPREEFLKAFEKVLSYVKEMEAKLLSQNDTSNTKALAQYDDLKKSLMTLHESMLSSTDTEFFGQLRAAVLAQVDTALGEQQRGMNYLYDKVRTLKNGTQGAPGEKGEKGDIGIGLPGPQGEPGSPDTPEMVRDKLETLQDAERLKASAIDGLDERLVEIDRKASRVMTPAKSYAIHKVDLSASCDGVTTTFSVGGTHFGIVGVFSTEFPIVYRPIIDYTETPTGFALTAQVSPPASGQTLIAQFLK